MTKKLIEVALPLDAINNASAREKSIRHRHPSTLHLWWSRKPLATCRAVLFASLIDDPSEHPEAFPTEQAQQQERLRLFRLMEELVKWENSNNEDLLAQARMEIYKSTNGNPPPVLDPFAGGGSIPLEAQRLGLEAHASDLNPVAVLINKALIEIPPKFAGRPPVNPEARQSLMGGDWSGARGLAEDIRYYGKWMHDEAERRIGHLYPKVSLPKEYGGGEATVIAWLWVRTVTCPNPACGAQMPLASKWWLSKKKGKEAWVEPQVDHSSTPPIIHFSVQTGKGKPQDGTVNRLGARCIACGTMIGLDYLRREGKANRIEIQLLAVVVEGKHGRVYLSATEEQVNTANLVKTHWMPEQMMPDNPRWFSPPLYGMMTFGDLFTPRQLVALTTFSDLVSEAREQVLRDMGLALCRELHQRQTPAGEFFWELVRERRFEGYKFRRQHPLGTFIADFYCPELRLAVELDGGIHATQVERDRARDEIFAQHGIRVVRIHKEEFLADPEATLARLSDLIAHRAIQDEAATAPAPTYADAQAYADAVATYLAIALDKGADYWSTICSWHAGRDTIRNTFARQAIPMVWDFAEANPFSESTGNFQGAIDWVAGVIEISPCYAMGEAKQRDATTSINGINRPLISTDPPYYDNIGYADLADFFYVWLRRSLSTIYPDLFKTVLVPKAQELVATPYRFGGSKSEAQEFFETGLGKAFERMRLAQHPDYPLTVYYAFKQAEAGIEDHDDEETGNNGNSAKVIASTGWETMLEGLIRAGFTITGTWPVRTEMLNRSVGLGTNALASSIVLVCRPRPVDAPIASRHSKVVESDGTPMRVRTALQLINRALDEALAEQEGEYDAETRWAIAWFEQFAMNAGEYGLAETLSKAKNTTVQGLVDAGLLEARGGKVRLLKRAELPDNWNPQATRLTVWEVMQRMIHALLNGSGEVGAAHILRQASVQGEAARDLAYRLYTVCERKGWAQEALAYNSLVTSWSEITRLAYRAADGGMVQGMLLG